MALMRFDPFRELDRLAEQALAGAPCAHCADGGVATR